MRIIGGDFAGRIIPESKNFASRPTTDLAKESLFNILNNDYYFDEIDVLDMFAGTGSISYEFASRGTEVVIALDIQQKNVNFVRNTSEKLGIEGITIIKGDAFKFASETNQKFDIIFADPPYDLENIDTIPDLIFKYELLKKEGLFIIEHSGKLNFKTHKNFLKFKRYGRVHFSFFG